jgi:Domain of unknown function (DUF4326)
MSVPKGIQLKRTRGWRKPPDAIVVSRPSRWGNPYRVGYDGINDASYAVALFEKWVLCSIEPRARWIRANLHLLRGHELACWCPLGSPCHRDVLLRFANAASPSHSFACPHPEAEHRHT